MPDQHRIGLGAVEGRPVTGGKAVKQPEDARPRTVASAEVITEAEQRNIAREAADIRGQVVAQRIAAPVVDDDQHEVVQRIGRSAAQRLQGIAQGRRLLELQFPRLAVLAHVDPPGLLQKFLGRAGSVNGDMPGERGDRPQVHGVRPDVQDVARQHTDEHYAGGEHAGVPESATACQPPGQLEKQQLQNDDAEQDGNARCPRHPRKCDDFRPGVQQQRQDVSIQVEPVVAVQNRVDDQRELRKGGRGNGKQPDPTMTRRDDNERHEQQRGERGQQREVTVQGERQVQCGDPAVQRSHKG